MNQEPLRPMLAHALAVTTGVIGYTHGQPFPPWLDITVAEAMEALAARGVIPAEWIDNPLRRWNVKYGACASCGSLSLRPGSEPSCANCLGSARVGAINSEPASLSDLVSWVSYGVPAISRAESIVRETVGAWGNETILWHVETALPPPWAGIDVYEIRAMGFAFDAGRSGAFSAIVCLSAVTP